MMQKSLNAKQTNAINRLRQEKAALEEAMKSEVEKLKADMQ